MALAGVFTHLEKVDNFDSNKYHQLRRIQSLLYEFDRLQVTATEYAYLKLISIFNPNNSVGKGFLLDWLRQNSPGLECMRVYDQIDAYRILSYKELQDYFNDRLVSTSFDECRIGRILLKLSSLPEFDTNIIEEIFFVGLIGKLIFTFIFYHCVRFWFISLFRFSANS